MQRVGSCRVFYIETAQIARIKSFIIRQTSQFCLTEYVCWCFLFVYNAVNECGNSSWVQISFVFGLDRSKEEVKVRKQSVRRILIMCLHYDNRYGSESILSVARYNNNRPNDLLYLRIGYRQTYINLTPYLNALKSDKLVLTVAREPIDLDAEFQDTDCWISNVGQIMSVYP